MVVKLTFKLSSPLCCYHRPRFMTMLLSSSFLFTFDFKSQTKFAPSGESVSETNPSEILFLTICSVQWRRWWVSLQKECRPVPITYCTRERARARRNMEHVRVGEEVVDGGLSAGACSVLSHPGWESTLVFLPSFNPQQAFYLDGPNSTFCQCKQKYHKNTITDKKWLYKFIGFFAKSGSG